MPRPPDRTYSFENDDESALDLNAIGHIRPEQYHQPQYASYRDTSPEPDYYHHPRDYGANPPPTPPTHRSPFRDRPPLPPPTDSTSSEEPRAPPAYTRPPPLRSRDVREQNLGHSTSNRTASTTTPGVDNMGETAAGGGIAGVALGVANHHERESGIEALRGMPQERAYTTTDTPYIPPPPNTSGGHRDPFASPAPSMRSTDPFDDANGRGPAASSPGHSTPNKNRSEQSIPLQQYPAHEEYGLGRSSYTDNPYNRLSTAWDPRISRGEIDPSEIEDDGDDGMMEPVGQRRSVLGMGTPSNQGPRAGAVGGAATGGIMGTLGGLVGKSNNNRSRDPSGQYGPVAGGQGFPGGPAEKSEWLNKQTSGNKRLRWIVGTIIILLVIGGIVGGVIGGIKASKSHGSGSSSGSAGQTAAQDDAKGDLNKDSPEIKALMNNPDLHQVFPGMDYTPYNAQYPACLSNMPSQNNVTRDMAVLSQLTNAVRLYGTDCNQTEMVLHSINALSLTDMKVWLGVWLGNNQTTNDRGLNAMNTILKKYGAEPFAGVIVGNEVLYREDLTETELSKILSDVKKNLTAMNIDLPLATSDLGDDWTAGLTSEVDIVMSNIHPFFAGTTAEAAAGWTWDFWQQHDVLLTKGTSKKNVISEVGWPSGGGNDCGSVNCTSKTQGSIAGVDEMNTFMDAFVCQSLANGTDYFWFEAFDEPWKIQFNKGDQNWEDKWGLMTIDRKLKPGVKIPDCGGNKTSAAASSRRT